MGIWSTFNISKAFRTGTLRVYVSEESSQNFCKSSHSMSSGVDFYLIDCLRLLSHSNCREGVILCPAKSELKAHPAAADKRLARAGLIFCKNVSVLIISPDILYHNNQLNLFVRCHTLNMII